MTIFTVVISGIRNYTVLDSYIVAGALLTPLLQAIQVSNSRIPSALRAQGDFTFLIRMSTKKNRKEVDANERREEADAAAPTKNQAS